MLQSWSYETRGRKAITLQSIKNLEKFRIFRAATEISWTKSKIFGKQQGILWEKQFFGAYNDYLLWAKFVKPEI